MAQDPRASVVSTYFGPEHASAYDDRWKGAAPLSETLHFLMRHALADLPAEARVLCVGAGTGAEILALARAFPGWRFTAVEPSAAMLEVCRRKAAAAGIAARCTFHEGFLESLPAAEPFEAATSILVSQFLVDPRERRRFFEEIASRLGSGGTLVTAELASPWPEPPQDLVEGWLRVVSGGDPDKARPSLAAWGTAVAVVPPREVEALVAAAGFRSPALFYQAFFLHAWIARKP